MSAIVLDAPDVLHLRGSTGWSLRCGMVLPPILLVAHRFVLWTCSVHGAGAYINASVLALWRDISHGSLVARDLTFGGKRRCSLQIWCGFHLAHPHPAFDTAIAQTSLHGIAIVVRLLTLPRFIAVHTIPTESNG